MNDLTVVYITANMIADKLAVACREQLVAATGGEVPIISVSKRPLDFGTNIVFDDPEASNVNVYKQACLGVAAAQTEFVAIAEDDTMYAPIHFTLRPVGRMFLYNVSCWQIYTWVHPATYSMKFRKNHNNLICERSLYLEEMEERFKRPEESKGSWSEPGRYQSHWPAGERFIHPPNVSFAHQQALGFAVQGDRKRLGHIRAYDIPYWGPAADLLARVT